MVKLTFLSTFKKNIFFWKCTLKTLCINGFRSCIFSLKFHFFYTFKKNYFFVKKYQKYLCIKCFQSFKKLHTLRFLIHIDFHMWYIATQKCYFILINNRRYKDFLNQTSPFLFSRWFHCFPYMIYTKWKTLLYPYDL